MANREMQAEGILDHLNEVDLNCLHCVFIPKINDRVKSFLEGWNNHSASTANEQIPSQMFISGLLLQLQHSNEVESDSNSKSVHHMHNQLLLNLSLCQDAHLFHVQYLHVQ